MIMQYRNRVFNRLKSPLKHKIATWFKSKVTVLTLVRGNFSIAIQQNRNISLLDNETVFEVSSEEFDDTRKKNAFNNCYRCKDGSHLAELEAKL